MTAAPYLICSDVTVEDMTPVGRTCLEQAILELERRFLGNTTEQRFQMPESIVINDQQLIATMLDLRTVRAYHLQDDHKERLGSLLKSTYVNFYAQYYKYDRMKNAKDADDSNSASSESDVVCVPATMPMKKKLCVEGKGQSNVSCGMTYKAINPQLTSNFLFSDDDEDSSTSEDEGKKQKTEEQLEAEDCEIASVEYKRVMKNWCSLQVDWSSIYSAIPEKPDLIEDLMRVDIGVLYNNLQAAEAKRVCNGKQSLYGLLPVMAACSIGKLGALNAEGYAEHVNSMGKLILTDGNSLLSDDEIDMLVTLRMNASFMTSMRTHYAGHLVACEQFGMTVISPAETEHE